MGKIKDQDAAEDDKRDDFLAPAIKALGGRAGYMCSFPSCRRLTIGPSNDRASRLSNVGVAAHITAASKKGPRYDSNISPEERASESNGIWMCQSHGKLVDDNASTHTVEQLRRWKQQHEDWVFRRLENGHNYVEDGVGYLMTEDLGPLPSAERLNFGRFTVVFGANATGKSTICETVSAFAGEPHFSAFANRWDFARKKGTSPKAIEAGLVLGAAQTRVRICDKGQGPEGAYIEVGGHLAPTWPQALFRAVSLDQRIFEGRGTSDLLTKGIEALAHQFRLPSDVLFAALRDEVFASSIYRCTFRRVRRKLQIKTPHGADFLPPENLAPTEKCWLLVALVLRLMEAAPGPTPWLLCLDTDFLGKFDDTGKKTLLESLYALLHIKLQVIACVVFEKDADLLQTQQQDRWLGSQRYGELTVHTFL